MPNHVSAEKRDRQAKRRRTFNRRNMSRMRTEMKKLRMALSAKKKDEALQIFNHVISIIDRTASKGVIHKNTAARYKSRLTLKLNALLA